MRLWTGSLLILALAFLGACTHVKGLVLDERTSRPFATARFSVGRPNGIGSFATYDVNNKGEFDFYLSPIDSGALYLYDKTGNPENTMRRLERSELSENMRLLMRPAPPEGSGLENLNILNPR